MDIDAVITWVDGKDPVLNAKRARYGDTGAFASEDVASATRFADLGEIFWCVASINLFAPYIRRIYIVTDHQDPHLEDFLQEHFPQGHIPVEIIDHTVIFRDHASYLPVFNSIALETLTWKIPGLSEHYVEFNDDFLLCAPTRPEDFFLEDGRPVCYCRRMSIPLVRFTRRFKKSLGKPKVTFKQLMIQGAALGGRKWSCIKIDHTPRALVRSVYEDCFTRHPELIRRNISCRFREISQFTPQLLHYTLLENEGRIAFRPLKGNLLYLKPKDKPGYVKRKIGRMQKDTGARFCCLNSLDMAGSEDLSLIKEWISSKLGFRI